MISSFLVYWADLQDLGEKQALEDGAELHKTTTLQLHPQQAPENDVGIVLLQ
ncbi:hypothetical protein HU200_013817 [Digitaria exilis]|uniref:Uncharacterized protein n=1 Tax=Digitaria exilis TaxID=1010633 RepID=A0A835FDA6_9POAL|nr:hypothetical protein HU200_013817 [Digitaria exilis]